MDLGSTSGNVIGTGGLLISGSSNPTTARLTASNQIDDTATVSITSNSSNSQVFDLNNQTETIGGLILTATSSATAYKQVPRVS